MKIELETKFNVGDMAYPAGAEFDLNAKPEIIAGICFYFDTVRNRTDVMLVVESRKGHSQQSYREQDARHFITASECREKRIANFAKAMKEMA